MTDSEPATYGNDRVDTAQVVRFVIVAVVAVAIVALALDNRHDVRLGYVFGDGERPGLDRRHCLRDRRHRDRMVAEAPAWQTSMILDARRVIALTSHVPVEL